MTATLPLLGARDRIVTSEGNPTLPFQNDWQKLAEEVETKLGSGATLTNAANDAAAAAGGVAVGSFYRDGSVVRIRIV